MINDELPAAYRFAKKKNKYFGFKINEEFLNLIREYTKEKGISVAEFIEYSMLVELKRNKKI